MLNKKMLNNYLKLGSIFDPNFKKTLFKYICYMKLFAM